MFYKEYEIGVKPNKNVSVSRSKIAYWMNPFYNFDRVIYLINRKEEKR